ncbi:MAG: DsrE/DsrF/DrsH-like family protein [Bacteroidales bacterium]
MPNFEEINREGAAQNTDNGVIRIDAKGSQCPGPIMALKDGMLKAAIGQQVEIEVTDPGFKTDATAWAAVTGNPMLSMTDKEGVITALFEKQTELGKAPVPPKEDSVTIVIFSDEMDKGLASFNIALGALAMGMKVQIFFTFWGISLLRKKPAHAEHKSVMGRMMEEILPADDKSLPLSHQNMLGIGARMMSRVMKQKNVPPLDFMLHLAKYDGVTFIACQMSMEILDIKLDELIDGVQVGGVATMIEYARKSNLNYFV